jgi:hypothetical protein
VAYYEDAPKLYTDRLEVLPPRQFSINIEAAFSLAILEEQAKARQIERANEPEIVHSVESETGSYNYTLYPTSDRVYKEVLQAYETHKVLSVPELSKHVKNTQAHLTKVRDRLITEGKIIPLTTSMLNRSMTAATASFAEELRQEVDAKLNEHFSGATLDYLLTNIKNTCTITDEELELLDAIFNKGCLTLYDLAEIGFEGKQLKLMDRFMERCYYQVDKIIELSNSNSTSVKMLKCVREHKALSARDIANYLGVHPTTASSIMNPFVKKKLIAKTLTTPVYFVTSEEEFGKMRYTNPLVNFPPYRPTKPEVQEEVKEEEEEVQESITLNLKEPQSKQEPQEPQEEWDVISEPQTLEQEDEISEIVKEEEVIEIVKDIVDIQKPTKRGRPRKSDNVKKTSQSKKSTKRA